MVKFYRDYGLVTEEMKIFTEEVLVGDEGKWTVDYSHINFRHIHSIHATPVYGEDTTANTPLGASITFFNDDFANGKCVRGTSLGLLVGVANLWAHPNTRILITVIGF